MKKHIPWLKNDALFKAELAKGRKWEAAVGKRFRELGCDVAAEYHEFNLTGEEAAKSDEVANTVDLWVNGHIVEVKSRNNNFTCAADFPYPTIAIDTKSGFDRKRRKPVVYVCVSQKTGCMTALDVKETHQHWEEFKGFDRVRRIPWVSYVCHKKYWETLEDVVERVLVPDTSGATQTDC